VAKQCSICGARLLTAEAAEGICEFCRPYSALPPRPPPPKASTVQGGPDWDLFRTGLNLLYIGTIINQCIAVVGGIAVMFRFDRTGDLLGFLEFIAPILIFVQIGMAIVGLLLLLGVPAASGLRGRAWAMVGSLLLVTFGFFLEIAFAPRQEGVILVLLCLASGVVVFVMCFAALLRGAARSLGDNQLGDRFVTFFVTTVLTLAGMLLIGFSMGRLLYSTYQFTRFDGHSGREFESCMMGLFVAVFVGFAGWFLVLLGRLRRATM
jgi:hypothetical protein